MKLTAIGILLPSCCSCLNSYLSVSLVSVTSFHRGGRLKSAALAERCPLQLRDASDGHFLDSPYYSSVEMTKKQDATYPVQVSHQGHVATIHVKEDEPILHALERQSISPGDISRPTSSLGLSSIPHECRRGNCLNCASRLACRGEEVTLKDSNIRANVNNGLSPNVSSYLTDNGFVLTCCSFITGPGVVLELDQSDGLWDRVYRSMPMNCDHVGMEARARLKRRLDENNVSKWKERMETLLNISVDNE